MKAFDSKDEYTAQEVKSALAGVNGVRNLSFRYERLNKNNQFLEEIDYVQDGTEISNNADADIKRVAKFKILDIGSINYLQDRIKPYCRVAMPADRVYSDVVKSLDPSVWWKIDEPASVTPTVADVNIADGLTYATRETAWAAPAITGLESVLAKVAASSGTHRSEFWAAYTIDTGKPLQFILSQYTSPTSANFEIYSSADSVSPLTLHGTYSSSPTGSTNVRIPFPVKGIYYVRMLNSGTTARTHAITVVRPARLEDTSGNGIYATGYNIGLGATPLIADGGKAISVASSQAVFWNSENHSTLLKDGLSFNWWMSMATLPTSGAYTAAHFKSKWTLGTAGTLEVIVEGQHGVGVAISVTFTSSDTSLYPNWIASTNTIPLSALVNNGAHMVTFTINPVNNTVKFFIDTKQWATLVDYPEATPISDYLALFENASLTASENTISALNGISIDEFVVFPTGIPTSAVYEIYDKAKNITVKRSGYVEWPLGVFLLSSPSRTMQDGNTITRDVEGYDQLVILKEDSFAYRFSIKAGTKYTKAVHDVLLTTGNYGSYPLTNSIWRTYYDASITSQSSGVFKNSEDLGQADTGSISIDPDTLSLKDIVVSAKVAGVSGANPIESQMLINYKLGTTSKKMEIRTSGANILFTDHLGNSITAVYNATTHAYWRLRELNGFGYWETSTNGTTWTVQRQEKLVTDTNPSAQVVFKADDSLTTAEATITNVIVNAYAALKTNVTDSTIVLPTALEWEPGTPKLEIINDLLNAINYESATYDEDGVFVVCPYVSPADKTSEFIYATDSESVIRGDIEQTADLFAVPNKFVVVVSETDRPVLVGTYTNTNPLSPTSTVSRGRTIVDYRTEQKAPDQTTLDAMAARLAFAASQVYESIEFNTALMPIHQNADVYTLIIDDLAISNKYSERSWSMSLEPGAVMKHRIRKVVNV